MTTELLKVAIHSIVNVFRLSDFNLIKAVSKESHFTIYNNGYTDSSVSWEEWLSTGIIQNRVTIPRRTSVKSRTIVSRNGKFKRIF